MYLIVFLNLQETRVTESDDKLHQQGAAEFIREVNTTKASLKEKNIKSVKQILR